MGFWVLGVCGEGRGGRGGRGGGAGTSAWALFSRTLRFADGDNLLELDIYIIIFYILYNIEYTGSPSLLAASGSSPARCNLLCAALAQEPGLTSWRLGAPKVSMNVRATDRGRESAV